MRTWFSKGLLPGTIKARQVDEPASAYKTIADKDCCFKKPAPASVMLPVLGVGMGGVPAPPAHIVNGRPDLSRIYGQQPATPFQPRAPAAAGGHVQAQRYEQVAMFNRSRGTFTTHNSQQHWESKGLSADRSGRQMDHYFDHNQWQEERNRMMAKKRAKRRVS